METVVGQKFEDYTKQTILNPLGMWSTGFEFTADVVTKMATGYTPDGNIAQLYNLGWNAPCGQMYSSGNDLAQLMIEFLQAQFMNNTKGILKDSTKKEMLSTSTFWY